MNDKITAIIKNIRDQQNACYEKVAEYDDSIKLIDRRRPPEYINRIAELQFKRNGILDTAHEYQTWIELLIEREA